MAKVDRKDINSYCLLACKVCVCVTGIYVGWGEGNCPAITITLICNLAELYEIFSLPVCLRVCVNADVCECVCVCVCVALRE